MTGATCEMWETKNFSCFKLNFVREHKGITCVLNSPNKVPIITEGVKLRIEDVKK